MTDLDDSSASLSSGATTVVEVHPQSSDEKSLGKLGKNTAEKFFEVRFELLFNLLADETNLLASGVRDLRSDGLHGFRYPEEVVED